MFEYKHAMRLHLPVDQSFDVVERIIEIGGRETCIYFVDGFIKDEIMQRIMTEFFTISKKEMDDLKTAGDFIAKKIPYVEAAEERSVKSAADAVLSGQTALAIQGYEGIILLDLRTYPVRGIGEPEKEKTLRGARDGLVETLVFNTSLIRRRIRDPRLVFEIFSVGDVSKTDVCIGYMKGVADDKLVDNLRQKLKNLKTDTLTVADQSLVEILGKSRWANPFPKVRYTERPDVVAAHLTEGKFAVLVDNSPAAIILPTYLFDFIQDVDDYYFPVITGNYFRIIRNLIMLLTLFATPVYMLLYRGDIALESGSFLLPEDTFNIPLFWQFIMLEIAIDGLKLASLNTPSSLGMSLSVIGALILGEFSVTAGWFIPQTILIMALVALAGFSQPSIELSYCVKFMRILLLAGAAALGIWGFLTVLVGELIVVATTKTLTGDSYLYPLIPFNGSKLKEMLLRTRKKT